MPNSSLWALKQLRGGYGNNIIKMGYIFVILLSA